MSYINQSYDTYYFSTHPSTKLINSCALLPHKWHSTSGSTCMQMASNMLSATTHFFFFFFFRARNYKWCISPLTYSLWFPSPFCPCLRKYTFSAVSQTKGKAVLSMEQIHGKCCAKHLPIKPQFKAVNYFPFHKISIFLNCVKNQIQSL